DLPILNLRLGIGKEFNRIGKVSNIFQFYGFFEFTNYQFDQADNLYPPFEKSDKRYDVAFYGMVFAFPFLSLGIGAHYTHEDNLIIYDFDKIISQSGPRSYFGLYYQIGVGYQIKIFDGFSLPVGLYYRRAGSKRFFYPGANARTYFALQLGIIYKLSE
ncbi:MAG: hypothetical protein KGJ59_15375, partial [Bacteroidota bacterium]|nr:hypothetical protein [Bacteroidota bacterium]